jgi:predicted dehydrogenase
VAAADQGGLGVTVSGIQPSGRKKRTASANGAGPGLPQVDRSLRVGVIGCGYWGPQVIRNFHEMLEAELVVVAEKRLDRADYVRRLYPAIETVSDHHALLRADIDCVVVATPIHTHYELARDALLAGKHVLVEKPLTGSLADALDLMNLAQERNRVLMVGHTFLYNPAVQALRKLVDDGELGRIYYVDAARLNLGQFHSHVDVMWDLAPHDVSIFLYVLQRAPVMVSARGSVCVQPGIHDVAYIELELEGGIRTQIHVSWLDPCKVRRLTIVGDQKMAVYNDVSLTEKIRIYDTGVEPPIADNFGEFQHSYRHGQMVVPYVPWQEPLRLQCEHFLQSVRTGATPLTAAAQGVAVVAVLEAASLSLANGGVRVPVDLQPDLAGRLTGPAKDSDLLGSLSTASAG